MGWECRSHGGEEKGIAVMRSMWAEVLEGEGGELQAVCLGEEWELSVDPSPKGWHLSKLTECPSWLVFTLHTKPAVTGFLLWPPTSPHRALTRAPLC